MFTQNSVTGYSNPLSMKNIDDVGLTNVEKFVRDNGLEIIERRLENLINCGETKSQMLLDMYGDTYNSAPEKFCFRDGDRMLIKELVVHVKKMVDANGINTGLHQFKMKVKKARHRRLPNAPTNETQRIAGKLKIENENSSSCDNRPEMAADLLRKVQLCLINHGADKLADIANLDDEMVNVTMENSRMYGTVTCLVCRDESKKTKKKLIHRVSYCPIKNYWVMSNFAKHLVEYHQLKMINSSIKRKSSKVESGSILCSGNSAPTEKKYIETHDESDDVYIIETIEVEIQHSKMNELSESNSNEEKTPLFKQLADQIAQMIGAVLLNDDQQHNMRFLHGDELTELTLAKITGDGNCMLAAIVHQIFRMPIDSAEHKAATIKLRQDIVEHILHPENFDEFKFTLQDRVYEMKTKSEIIDMVAESKHFVQNVLSMNGYWAGHECLIAATRIFSVNIIVFDEDGTYYLANDGKIFYNQTIAIAYRIGQKKGNEIIRIHYDSVSDISSDNIYKATNSIENRMEKKAKSI